MSLHLRPSSVDDSSEVIFRQKPDGNRDPAGETGWFLQRERERCGKTLADAALETQISARYLQAIEMGTLADLPARSYVLGYIRVYAEFLHLEPEPLVEQYKRLIADTDRGGSGGFGRALTLVSASVLFLAVMFAGAWFLLPDLIGGGGQQTASNPPNPATPASGGDETIETGSVDPVRPTQDPNNFRDNDNDDEAADRIAEMLDEAVPTVVVRQEGFADGETPITPPDDGLQPGDMEAVTPQGDDDPTSLTEFIRQHVTDAVDPVPAGEGQTLPSGVIYGEENQDARIVLHANKSVWIRVEDADGRIMITRTLQVGDSYRVPDREGLVLIARDGGALDYSIDGEMQGAVGAPGEIVVGRPLEIGGMRRT